MKILITVDPEIPVPPTNYGGIERIVDGLIGAYREQGHEVFLTAHPESSNQKVTQKFDWPAISSRGIFNVLKNTIFLKGIVNNIKPDIIHSFSRLLYLYPVFIEKKFPVIQSYQRKISEKSTKLASLLAGNMLSFTCCGEHMIQDRSLKTNFEPIHNFTDTNYFIPNKKTEKDALFFLGRIEDIKGTKEAIDVAIATKSKLIIAGNVQEGHGWYFEKSIKPHLGNELIEYVGPVDDQKKLELFHRAKAFLFPIKWEEPFGIVMAEALACGVPVIGFDRGSVPEVVKDGVTGFIVKDVTEMVAAVNKIGKIDRKLVRQDCEERFSLEIISRKYLDVYEKMRRPYF